MPAPPAPLATATTPRHRRLTPIWRNVSFTLMWTSTAASGFGDRIIMLAALVLLGGLVPGAAEVSINGAINFFFFLPYLILSIPGGWLADRVPRKWLLLACDEARALILLVAFFMVGSASGAVVPEPYQWRVLAIMFAVGCFAAIFGPTRNAIVPQIIPLPQLQPANAVLLSITTIASMIGLLVGNAIIDPTDGGTVQTGVFLAFLFYAVSGMFFAFMRVQRQSDKPFATSDSDSTPRMAHRSSPIARARPSAVRFVLHHRRIMVLIGMSVLVWAAAMIVFQAVLALAKRAYGFGTENEQLAAYTWLAAMLGFGMIAGAAVVAIIRTRRESGIVLWAGVTGAGLCALLLGAVPVYGLALASAFGVGLFGNVTIISITSLLQSMTPNYLRGRIMGVSNVLNTTTNVAISFALWQTPGASHGIWIGLLVLGPGLALLGLAGLWRSLTRGPFDLKAANFFWRLVRLYCLVWHRLEWRGRHRVPSRGPVILAPNHTTGLDPLLIQAPSLRSIRWLMYTSYRFGPLEPLWAAIRPITMDKASTNTAKIRQVVEALQDGDAVGFFPEGRLQRDSRELHPLQPGIAMIQRRSGAPIVPVWVEGTPQRKNMLWHFLQPSRSRVTFGEPYTPPEDWDTKQILDDLRERMLRLSTPHGQDA